MLLCGLNGREYGGARAVGGEFDYPLSQTRTHQKHTHSNYNALIVMTHQ